MQALPSHVMAVLLGYLSGVLRTGPEWAAELTDCTLTDSGPLDHAVRGASVMVTFLELTPRFRCLSAGMGAPACFCCLLMTTTTVALCARLQQHADRPGTGWCVYMQPRL